MRWNSQSSVIFRRIKPLSVSLFFSAAHERLQTKAIEHYNMQLNGRFRLRTRGLENAYSEQKNTMTLITNLFSCPQPSIVWQLGWNRIEIKEERAKSYRKVNRVVSISYQTCTRKASDSRLLSFFSPDVKQFQCFVNALWHEALCLRFDDFIELNIKSDITNCAITAFYYTLPNNLLKILK